MMSEAYQMASAYDDGEDAERDPEKSTPQKRSRFGKIVHANAEILEESAE